MRQHGLTLILALVVAAVAGYALALHYPPPGLQRGGCDCGYGCGCGGDGGKCEHPKTCPAVHNFGVGWKTMPSAN